MRIIEVIADCGHTDTLRGIAEQHNILECWTLPTAEEDNRCSTRILVRPEKQQTVIDAIQQALGKTENTRILILPVDGVLPRPQQDQEEEKKRALTRSREELYQLIESGSMLDNNFIFMVIVSTIVASIGLLEDNVAVVIGAMVIAPLLGPNIALAFGAALGDMKLMWRALKTNTIGLTTALAMSIVTGLIWPLNFDSVELMARTDVGLDGIALALASGAAAVLSLTTGWTSSLVGVMVAVALLPPAATLGLMLGAGNFSLALGAGLLLAVNIVCVNLSAKMAFFVKGIRPRTWLEQQKAKQSMLTYIVFWIVVLVILLVVMNIRQHHVIE